MGEKYVRLSFGRMVLHHAGRFSPLPKSLESGQCGRFLKMCFRDSVLDNFSDWICSGGGSRVSNWGYKGGHPPQEDAASNSFVTNWMLPFVEKFEAGFAVVLGKIRIGERVLDNFGLDMFRRRIVCLTLELQDGIHPRRIRKH